MKFDDQLNAQNAAKSIINTRKLSVRFYGAFARNADPDQTPRNVTPNQGQSLDKNDIKISHLNLKLVMDAD